MKYCNLRRYKIVRVLNNMHINYLSIGRKSSSLSSVAISSSIFEIKFAFVSIILWQFLLFVCSSNRANNSCYCRLNADNIIIIGKIVVDIKQNKFFSIASFLKFYFFFDALSSFMYGMLSFCARFCGCHLVKQQPSLSSLLLLAAVTT
jgi:hypothetical protein